MRGGGGAILNVKRTLTSDTSSGEAPDLFLPFVNFLYSRIEGGIDYICVELGPR